MNRSEALLLIDKSRFRHTEKGSFVIKVSTPVKSMAAQADIFEDTPFVRQTTLVINHSIAKLVGAIQADKIEQLITDTKKDEKPLLSSNICKALINFQEENARYDLYLNFKWVSVIDKPTDTKNLIKVQKDYYSRIEEIRQELKNQEEDKEDTFVGTVEQLAGELDEHEQRAGNVVLDLYHQDGESIRAKVNLKAEWHSKAIESYRNGSFIKIKGKLLMAGNKTKSMKDITYFNIIDDGK
jgi:hypothetical protein